MKKIITITLLSLILINFSCKKESPNTITENPTLLFSSGFEDGVYIDETPYEDSEDYRFIRGKDEETGFSWPIDILGANESAIHYVDDDNFKAVESEIQKWRFYKYAL